MSYINYVTKSAPKIIGIGFNYVNHVNNLGANIKIPQQPLLFQKPWSSLAFNPQKLFLKNTETSNIVHEIEFGIFINKSGVDIPRQKAINHIGQYFIGIDFSDRILMKSQSGDIYPYMISKGQDNFCPVSLPFSKDIDPYRVELQLKVNNEVRQKDCTVNMHFKIDQIISYISSYMKLEEGDLILTGTPSGTSRVEKGDRIESRAIYEGRSLTQMSFEII